MVLFRKLLFVAILVFGSLPAYGLMEVTTAVGCPQGSMIDVAWTTLIYNSSGRLVSGMGVCCDGSTWAKNFDNITSGDGGSFNGLDAKINWSSSNVLTVTSNMVIDVQIVNLQTGQFVTDMYHYTHINTPFSVSVAHLPLGLYGAVLSYNGSPVHLLPFSLPGQ